MSQTEGLEPGEWEFWDDWTTAQRLLARELERGLQRDHGISKAEFSVLVRLWRAPAHTMRVCDLVSALDWEKSRVSHLLTRMEKRGFVARPEGAAGRRTRTGLTASGRRVADAALRGHGDTVRRHFFDPLTPEEAATIREWSARTIDRLTPCEGRADDDGAA
ncbi:MarR family winged helix-turn-helix transcriptional regulator [Streptomyces sp. NPDC050560]|uniref:MarR family winged helix-turn-helix transcriptional regulator n=1 Tax=Streptomyces sp. NPDC050560 TaxID=3365630 RepID=UPI0037B4900B